MIAYRVELPKALGQDETVAVSARLVLTHSVEPYPHAIAQNDRQLLRYVDNHYFFAPYTVKHQRTNVRLPTSNIESKSELNPTTVKGDVITYGPYDNVAPFEQSKLMVHYENNKPVITITRLSRDIEVSHWGNVAIEDGIISFFPPKQLSAILITLIICVAHIFLNAVRFGFAARWGHPQDSILQV